MRIFTGDRFSFYQAVAKIESRRGLVARESSHLVLHGAVRLDHESRRFRIDRCVCEHKWSISRRFIEIPQTGHTFQHYLSMADAFTGKARAVRSQNHRIHDRLVGTQQRNHAG